MKNLVLVLTMFGAVALALGWIAFTGMGARTSDAPPVVVDWGTHQQRLRREVPAPEVTLESEPFDRPATSRAAAGSSRPDQRSLKLPAQRKEAIALARISKPTAATPRESAGINPPTSREPVNRSGQAEPRPRPVPNIPAAEHYAPHLEDSDENSRELPIVVRKEPPQSPTEAEIEANREWRRQVLDRWAREEAANLARGIEQHQNSTKARPRKPKSDNARRN
jgi:hypothetical protein